MGILLVRKRGWADGLVSTSPWLCMLMLSRLVPLLLTPTELIIDATCVLKRKHPHVRVNGLSILTARSIEAATRGAVAFINKETGTDALYYTILTVRQSGRSQPTHSIDPRGEEPGSFASYISFSRVTHAKPFA